MCVQAWDGDLVDGMHILETQTQFTDMEGSQDAEDPEDDHAKPQEFEPQVDPSSPGYSVQLSDSDEVIPDSEEDFRQVQDESYSPDNRWAIGINPSQVSQSQPSFQNSDSEDDSLALDANATSFRLERPEFVQGTSGHSPFRSPPRAASPSTPHKLSHPLSLSVTAPTTPPRLDERKKRRSHDDSTASRKRPKLEGSSRSMPVQRVTSPTRVHLTCASSIMDPAIHTRDTAENSSDPKDDDKQPQDEDMSTGKMGRSESEGHSGDCGGRESTRPDKGKGRQRDAEEEDEAYDDWETRLETPEIVKITRELSPQPPRGSPLSSLLSYYFVV